MRNTVIVCPVSESRVNENVVRVVAFFTILVTIIGVYVKSPLLIAVLALDFFLRAFTSGKYSPLKAIAKQFADYAGLLVKPTDAAPKKFAAGIGFFFTVTIAALLFLNYTVSADLVSVVLLICAGLESFRGFCLGCIIYTYIVLPFLTK